MRLIQIEFLWQDEWEEKFRVLEVLLEERTSALSQMGGLVPHTIHTIQAALSNLTHKRYSYHSPHKLVRILLEFFLGPIGNNQVRMFINTAATQFLNYYNQWPSTD